jgi:hypothetical protein
MSNIKCLLELKNIIQSFSESDYDCWIKFDSDIFCRDGIELCVSVDHSMAKSFILYETLENININWTDIIRLELQALMKQLGDIENQVSSD